MSGQPCGYFISGVVTCKVNGFVLKSPYFESEFESRVLKVCVVLAAFLH